MARDASPIVAASCQFRPIQPLSSHQSKTVAAEPQLPGPGRRRPVPKKVATSLAQSGARGRDDGGEKVLESGCVFWSDSVVIGIVPHRVWNAFGCVLHWRGDHVSAALPFSQINSAAAVAAEREFRIFAFHRFLANWPPQVERALASHKSLYDLR